MKFKERQEKKDPRESWHRKFAWFPTKMDHYIVWLEFYNRKRRFVPKLLTFVWDRQAIWKRKVNQKGKSCIMN